MSERRHPRRDYTTRVVIHHSGTNFICETLQISEGGMLLSMPQRASIGDSITIDFEIQGQLMHSTCEVLYIIPESGACNLDRVGIWFADLPETHRDTIRFFTTPTQAAAS